MSALFALTAGDSNERDSDGAALDRSLRRQGFVTAERFDWNGGSLHWYRNPAAGAASQACYRAERGGFAICVGTVVYRGQVGEAALRDLWHDFETPESVQTSELLGSYQLAIGKAGQVWLFADAVGMVKLYHARVRQVLCTSWLACVEATDSPRIDRFGALEYILEGANHGDRTPVNGVGICDPALAIELTSGRTRTLWPVDRWIERAPLPSIEAASRTCSELLVDRMTRISRAFDGNTRCALSGGFDSRLIVAALVAAGSRPSLFVYGRPDDSDVRISGLASAAIDLPIEVIDKSVLREQFPPLAREGLLTSLDFFDGLPVDGIFDSGVDRSTRIAQSAGGAAVLNGGGGEIFRNFFYLPDRPMTAAEVVQGFYSGYLPQVFRSAAEHRDYQERMAASIEAVVGSGRLDRAQVELIYPLFRNRFWAGRNNSIAARVGSFLTPLLDKDLIRICTGLPLSWKNYGRLQSKLIAGLDQPLAAVPLSYGFTPARGPSPLYQAKMFVEQHRPPWLRQRAAQLKHRLGISKPAPRDPSIASLVDEGLVRPLLNCDMIVDGTQWLRAMTIAALIQYRDIRLQ
ncbi:MAG: hypothetical protein QM766_25560 [Burkholderiaceae bacterium]